jgi:hypothetical protein
MDSGSGRFDGWLTKAGTQTFAAASSSELEYVELVVVQ